MPVTGASDRDIRRLLKQDGRNVSAPDDMWAKISNSLEREPPARYRQTQALERKRQWQNGLVFTMAVAAFWVVVLPASLQTVDNFPPTQERRGALVSHQDTRFIEGAARWPDSGSRFTPDLTVATPDSTSRHTTVSY